MRTGQCARELGVRLQLQRLGQGHIGGGGQLCLGAGGQRHGRSALQLQLGAVVAQGRIGATGRVGGGHIQLVLLAVVAVGGLHLTQLGAGRIAPGEQVDAQGHGQLQRQRQLLQGLGGRVVGRGVGLGADVQGRQMQLLDGQAPLPQRAQVPAQGEILNL